MPTAGGVGTWDRPETGAALRLGLITGVSGLLVSLLTTAIAVSTGSTTTAVVCRAVLLTALLVLTARAVAIKLHRSTGGEVLAPVVAGLVLGYLLDLGWWGGHAYVAQLVVNPPVVRAALDGALWVAVGSLAARRLRPASASVDPG